MPFIETTLVRQLHAVLGDDSEDDVVAYYRSAGMNEVFVRLTFCILVCCFVYITVIAEFGPCVRSL